MGQDESPNTAAVDRLPVVPALCISRHTLLPTLQYDSSDLSRFLPLLLQAVMQIELRLVQDQWNQITGL